MKTATQSDSKSDANGQKAAHLSLVLRDSELRYRRLFETAQDGILILNAATGDIIDANPFLLDLLDYPFDDVVGLKLWQIGQFRDIAANQAAFERLQKNEYIRYENLPLRTKQGRNIQVEFVSNVYTVGSEKIIQCNIRDISTRAEAGARSKIEMGAIELASKAKDEFLAKLSHELRTPLAAISSMLDLLDVGHDIAHSLKSIEGAHEFDDSALALIRRNVKALTNRIDDLLDVTHIARSNFSLGFETLDAHETVRTALKKFRRDQIVKMLDIDIDLRAEHHHVKGDPAKLHKVFVHLLGNAVKFTPHGGKISVSSENSSDNYLLFRISDQGIGIAPEVMPRISLAFEQGDASIHQRFGGLGLGLAISQGLLTAHDASVELNSEGPGKGTTVMIRFPVQPPPLEKGSSDTGLTIGASVSRRILLVEDHPDTCRCVCLLLESLGHQVHVANDLSNAQQLGDSREFDLLITDVLLPDGSGLDLLQQLRKRRPNLQGISISGNGAPQDMSRSEQAGYSRHITKPMGLDELRSAIEELRFVAPRD